MIKDNKKIAENYTKEQRIKNFKNKLPPNTKKIIMVSDFINKI